MKNLLVAVLLLTSISGFSQECTTPVSNSVFQAKYRQVAKLETDQKKLDLTLTFSVVNCFTSNQIKLVAKLFAKDSYRLEYCKLSYSSIVDKHNFYDVYDSFSAFSSAIKLYEYVANISKDAKPDITSKDPATPILTFPKYKYPNWQQYKGTKGCSTPISDRDFIVLTTPFIKYRSDEERNKNGSYLIKNNCLSLAHTMKLASLFTMESKALNFLKENVKYVYDQGNYAAASQCFSHNPYKTDWKNYCKKLFSPPVPVEPITTCNVDEPDFNTMVKNVDKAGFADDQIVIVRALNNHHCFSTAQVKQLMDEFSFPNNKFDVAKLLYDKCTDRKNYYTLKGQFLFISYEEKFKKMINAN